MLRVGGAGWERRVDIVVKIYTIGWDAVKSVGSAGRSLKFHGWVGELRIEMVGG